MKHQKAGRVELDTMVCGNCNCTLDANDKPVIDVSNMNGSQKSYIRGLVEGLTHSAILTVGHIETATKGGLAEASLSRQATINLPVYVKRIQRHLMSILSLMEK